MEIGDVAVVDNVLPPLPSASPGTELRTRCGGILAPESVGGIGMSQITGGAPAKPGEAENGGGAVRRGHGRLALELVATRGKDVVGVRHVLDGGRAWVGNVADAIARVSSRDLGGHPHLVGEARAGTFAVCVPPRARARLHG